MMTAPTVMKWTIERKNLAFAQFWHTFISTLNAILQVALAIIMLSGLDLHRLIVHQKFKFAQIAISDEYFAPLYQIRLVPLFILFFTYVKQFVGSKITKETLTVVQEFGV